MSVKVDRHQPFQYVYQPGGFKNKLNFSSLFDLMSYITMDSLQNFSLLKKLLSLISKLQTSNYEYLKGSLKGSFTCKVQE